MNTTFPEPADRPVPHQVRDVFESACRFLAPVMAGNDQVITISNFAMTHMLNDRFPDLSQAEIQIVILTVQKIHRSERIHSILNKIS